MKPYAAYTLEELQEEKKKLEKQMHLANSNDENIEENQLQWEIEDITDCIYSYNRISNKSVWDADEYYDISEIDGNGYLAVNIDENE